MSRKKIAFITHYDRLYGANRALLQLILGVAAEGAYEPLLVIPAEGEMTKQLREAGVECIISPITQWAAIYVEAVSFSLKKKKRLQAIQEEVEHLLPIFREAGVEIIHSNTGVICHGAMLAKALDCRHIWHIREFAKEHYGMEYFLPKEKVRSFFEEADCLVAISDAIRRSLETKYPEATVMRIYDGIDVHRDIPDKEAQEIWESPEEKPKHIGDTAMMGEGTSNHEVTEFLCTGYLFPAKRQLDVLKAAAILKKKGLLDFHITLAGDGSPAYYKRLSSWKNRYQLRDHVTLAGYTEDMDSLLKKADVGLMPSAWEGFGLATAEYMLYGLPVLGYESGATPELVADGANGRLYRDVKGLAKAMAECMQEPEKMKEMGLRGRAKVLARFPMEKNTEEILRLYHCFYE